MENKIIVLVTCEPEKRKRDLIQAMLYSMARQTSDRAREQWCAFVSQPGPLPDDTKAKGKAAAATKQLTQEEVVQMFNKSGFDLVVEQPAPTQAAADEEEEKVERTPLQRLSEFQSLKQLWTAAKALLPEKGDDNNKTWVCFGTDTDYWHADRLASYHGVLNQLTSTATTTKKQPKVHAVYSTRYVLLERQSAFQSQPVVHDHDTQKNARAGVTLVSVNPQSHDCGHFTQYAVRADVLDSFFSRAPKQLLAHPLCDNVFAAFITRLPGPALSASQVVAFTGKPNCWMYGRRELAFTAQCVYKTAFLCPPEEEGVSGGAAWLSRFEQMVSKTPELAAAVGTVCATRPMSATTSMLGYLLFTVFIAMLQNEPKQWRAGKLTMFQAFAKAYHINSGNNKKQQSSSTVMDALVCLYAAADTMLDPLVFEDLGLCKLYRAVQK